MSNEKPGIGTPLRTQSRPGSPDIASLRRLRTLPGVGPSIARDLWELGIREPGDLAGRDPGQAYEELCALRGQRIDRCLLYVFRCAVHFAETGETNPKKLRWWYWKDRK